MKHIEGETFGDRYIEEGSGDFIFKIKIDLFANSLENKAKDIYKLNADGQIIINLEFASYIDVHE